MRQNPANLAKQNPQKLAAPRHFEPDQFLDREAKGMFLIHRRDIVEPIEVRYVLQISAGLHQLLSATMKEADVRVDAFDNFAVEFENEPQDSMRRRMLRAKIDRKIADRIIAHGSDLQLISFNSPGPGQCGLFLAFSSPGNT